MDAISVAVAALALLGAVAAYWQLAEGWERERRRRIALCAELFRRRRPTVDEALAVCYADFRAIHAALDARLAANGMDSDQCREVWRASAACKEYERRREEQEREVKRCTSGAWTTKSAKSSQMQQQVKERIEAMENQPPRGLKQYRRFRALIRHLIDQTPLTPEVLFTKGYDVCCRLHEGVVLQLHAKGITDDECRTTWDASIDCISYYQMHRTMKEKRRVRHRLEAQGYFGRSQMDDQRLKSLKDEMDAFQKKDVPAGLRLYERVHTLLTHVIDGGSASVDVLVSMPLAAFSAAHRELAEGLHGRWASFNFPDPSAGSVGAAWDPEGRQHPRLRVLLACLLDGGTLSAEAAFRMSFTEFKAAYDDILYVVWEVGDYDEELSRLLWTAGDACRDYESRLFDAHDADNPRQQSRQVEAVEATCPKGHAQWKKHDRRFRLLLEHLTRASPVTAQILLAMSPAGFRRLHADISDAVEARGWAPDDVVATWDREHKQHTRLRTLLNYLCMPYKSKLVTCETVINDILQLTREEFNSDYADLSESTRASGYPDDAVDKQWAKIEKGGRWLKKGGKEAHEELRAMLAALPPFRDRTPASPASARDGALA